MHRQGVGGESDPWLMLSSHALDQSNASYAGMTVLSSATVRCHKHVLARQHQSPSMTARLSMTLKCMANQAHTLLMFKAALQEKGAPRETVDVNPLKRLSGCKISTP